MKLKRICAFLIMVFALSGCAGDMSADGAMVNTNSVSNTVISKLTQRENDLLSLHMENQPNFSLKNEVRTYAVKDVFQMLADTSKAEQYQAPEPEPEIEAVEVNTVQEEPAVSADAAFEIKTTLYGVDCYGCNVREDGTGNTVNQDKGDYRSERTAGALLGPGTADGYGK